MQTDLSPVKSLAYDFKGESEEFKSDTVPNIVEFYLLIFFFFFFYIVPIQVQFEQMQRYNIYVSAKK